MKIIKPIIVILSLLLILSLTACTQKAATVSTEPATTETTTEASAAVGYKEGAAKMQEVLIEMTALIDQKEFEKATAISEDLEANWAIFEDGLKEKSPELYDQVEDPLGMIQAAVKMTPFDEDTVRSEIIKLDEVLKKIKDLE